MYSNKDFNSGCYVYFRVGGWDIENFLLFLRCFHDDGCSESASRGDTRSTAYLVWIGHENIARQDSHANPSIVIK
jgi:hypothetical protein